VCDLSLATENLDMTDTLSATGAISYGWDATKRNLGVLLPLGALQLVVSSLGGGAGGEPITALLAQAAQVALAIGWWQIALRIHDGKPATLAVLGELSVGLFLQYFVATIFYGLAVAIGLVLLVVPGLVWGARYAFAPVAVVDERLDPVAAMKRSAELTRGVLAELWILALLLVGVNLLGLLALGIGLAVTIPISTMAVARTYRQLQARAAERGIAPAPEVVVGAPAEVAS
jgi:hypothetical protein